MLSAFDRLALLALVIACAVLAALAWLGDHPQSNPWAPLNIADPPGWTTARKFAALRSDLSACRAFLRRSDIDSSALPPTGEGACRRTDRAVIVLPPSTDVLLAPRGAQATCAVDAGLAWWLRHGVEPAARTILRADVVRIEHLGTGNCRRIAGSRAGTWSEHATGNAIDVSAFVLSDGRRVSVRRDWRGEGDRARFLHAVRDSACQAFATVPSPDYNAAHADHLHLDQAARPGGWSACR